MAVHAVVAVKVAECSLTYLTLFLRFINLTLSRFGEIMSAVVLFVAMRIIHFVGPCAMENFNLRVRSNKQN